MKRILTWALAVTVIIGGFIAIMWDVETWRMYDGNWQALAMTEAESYCAGFLLGESSFSNEQDVQGMQDCTANSKLDNTVPNIAKSVHLACTGLNATYNQYDVGQCESDVENFDIWFLRDGGYTWTWTSGNPRPVAAYTDIRKVPRGDTRSDDTRNTGGRLDGE